MIPIWIHFNDIVLFLSMFLIRIYSNLVSLSRQTYVWVDHLYKGVCRHDIRIHEFENIESLRRVHTIFCDKNKLYPYNLIHLKSQTTVHCQLSDDQPSHLILIAEDISKFVVNYILSSKKQRQKKGKIRIFMLKERCHVITKVATEMKQTTLIKMRSIMKSVINNPMLLIEPPTIHQC